MTIDVDLYVFIYKLFKTIQKIFFRINLNKHGEIKINL